MNRNSLLVSEESWSRWRGDSIELMLSISRVRHWDLYWIMSQYFYVFREFLQVTTRGAFHIIVPGTVLQLNVQCSEIELTTNENWTQHRSGVLSSHDIEAWERDTCSDGPVRGLNTRLIDFNWGKYALKNLKPQKSFDWFSLIQGLRRLGRDGTTRLALDDFNSLSFNRKRDLIYSQYHRKMCFSAVKYFHCLIFLIDSPLLVLGWSRVIQGCELRFPFLSSDSAIKMNRQGRREYQH